MKTVKQFLLRVLADTTSRNLKNVILLYLSLLHKP
jgi:hypothetical protein